MTTVRERLQSLVEAVLRTEPEEIDCEGFLERAAELLESLSEEGEVPSELARVSQHLSVCPECREEFEALMRAVG